MTSSSDGPATDLVEERIAIARSFDRVPHGGPSPADLRGDAPPDLVLYMPWNSAPLYEVTIVRELLSQDSPYLPNLLKTRRILFVTTPSVHRFYGEALDRLADVNKLISKTVILKCNEQNKEFNLVKRVCEFALDHGLGREDILVAVGGGICSDVVTVAASLIRRGIAHIRIPTTLVGQIDASVGIKGAVNFCGKKSYVGCFYPPNAVLIDPIFLKTLPPNELRNGLAEIIKIAVVRNAELFELLDAYSETLISSSFQEPKECARRILGMAVASMIEELKPNLYEDRTYERLVDMGHTFSPYIEAASEFTIRHGEAVAIDIILSSTISHRLGLISEDDFIRIISVIESVGLPRFSSVVTLDLCVEAMKESARHRGGSVNLVLPTRIGGATFLRRCDHLPKNVLQDSIRYAAKIR
jgi:3-dehydroquinate synthetase